LAGFASIGLMIPMSGLGPISNKLMFNWLRSVGGDVQRLYSFLVSDELCRTRIHRILQMNLEF